MVWNIFKTGSIKFMEYETCENPLLLISKVVFLHVEVLKLLLTMENFSSMGKRCYVYHFKNLYVPNFPAVKIQKF